MGVNMQLSELNLTNVIDIATGVGQFIPSLLNENKDIESIVGVDTCERSIAQAEKNFSDPRVSFMVADAANLSYLNDSFSGVTINNSLHHFEDVNSVLLEAKRVLSPTGYLIINEMCNDNNQSPSQQSHIMIHHWFAEFDKFMNRFHDLTYTSDKICKLISHNGFKIIHQEIYDSKIPDPKDDKLIENYTNIILTMKKRANKNGAPLIFLKQANKIIKHLKQYGFSPARNIIIIAKKISEVYK